MKRDKFTTKTAMIIFLMFAITVSCLPLVYADVTVDGVVDETDWTWWFDDETDKPYVELYWWINSDNIYLSIITDDTTDNDDILEFAYRTSTIDYWIKVKCGEYVKYRPSGGSWQGWWDKANSGEPPGVDIAYGMTDGNRSYEISIDISKWGKDSSTYPDNLVFWLKVQDNAPNGPINYYPNMWSEWWFQVEAGVEKEKPEMLFSVPELPLGTLMALISMFAAILIYAKKPQFNLKI